MKFDTNAAVKGIPPAMKDRYVVRCTDVKFGPNRNDNPMITCNWELIGLPNPDGTVQTSVKRGDKEYVVAGLRCQPKFFTLTEKAARFYKEFWEAAHPGETLEELDETNPDIAFFDGLCMTAICTGSEVIQRKELTEEEKQEKVAKGEKPVGDPIVDDDGKPMKRTQVDIIEFYKKWEGELPAEVGTF